MRRNIFLLGLTSLLTDISSEMVYPIIPLFLASTLGAGPAVLGLIEGVAESAASLVKMVSGYLSDQWGKRKPLAAGGYGLSVFGKLGLAIAGAWGTVLASRALDRIGKGIRTAPRDALIAESSEPGHPGRAFGIHRAMDTLGAALGVGLALILLQWYGGDLRAVLLWSVVPAVVGVGILWFVVDRGSHTPRNTSSITFRWKTLPPDLKRFLAVSGLFTLGNSSNTFLILRAYDLQFTPGATVALYLVYNLVYAMASYPAGKWSDKVGRKSVVMAGYFTYALVYAGVGMIGSPEETYVFWFLMAGYGLFSALTDGGERALVNDLAAPPLRATSLGLHAMIAGIGLFPASFLAGQLWERVGPSAPFFFGGGIGLLAAAGMAGVRTREPR